MTVWTDAQVSPALAGWLRRAFGVEAHAVRGFGLREAEDPLISARAGGAEYARTGRPPAFALEAVGIVFAPPFGLPLSYAVGRAGAGPWSGSSPLLNWALVGLLAGVLVERRRRRARAGA